MMGETRGVSFPCIKIIQCVCMRKNPVYLYENRGKFSREKNEHGGVGIENQGEKVWWVLRGNYGRMLRDPSCELIVP